MNYHVEFRMCPRPQLVQVLKNAPVEDTFIFLIADHQESSFWNFVNDHQLNNLIAYQMERPITNASHSNKGRSIRLVVFSKTPIKEDVYGTEGFIRGQISAS